MLITAQSNISLPFAEQFILIQPFLSGVVQISTAVTIYLPLMDPPMDLFLKTAWSKMFHEL